MSSITLRWCEELLGDGGLLRALLHTVLIGLGAVSVAVLLGHASFTVPIVMFQIMARIARMGPNCQSADMDLGANPAQTFWYATLPVFIYGMLRFGLSPKVYAISTIILFLSLALVILMARYTGRSAEAYRVRRRPAER